MKIALPCLLMPALPSGCSNTFNQEFERELFIDGATQKASQAHLSMCMNINGTPEQDIAQAPGVTLPINNNSANQPLTREANHEK